MSAVSVSVSAPFSFDTATEESLFARIVVFFGIRYGYFACAFVGADDDFRFREIDGYLLRIGRFRNGNVFIGDAAEAVYVPVEQSETDRESYRAQNGYYKSYRHTDLYFFHFFTAFEPVNVAALH